MTTVQHHHGQLPLTSLSLFSPPKDETGEEEAAPEEQLEIPIDPDHANGIEEGQGRLFF